MPPVCHACLTLASTRPVSCLLQAAILWLPGLPVSSTAAAAASEDEGAPPGSATLAVQKHPALSVGVWRPHPERAGSQQVSRAGCRPRAGLLLQIGSHWGWGRHEGLAAGVPGPSICPSVDSSFGASRTSEDRVGRGTRGHSSFTGLLGTCMVAGSVACSPFPTCLPRDTTFALDTLAGGRHLPR